MIRRPTRAALLALSLAPGLVPAGACRAGGLGGSISGAWHQAGGSISSAAHHAGGVASHEAQRIGPAVGPAVHHPAIAPGFGPQPLGRTAAGVGSHVGGVVAAEGQRLGTHAIGTTHHLAAGVAPAGPLAPVARIDGSTHPGQPAWAGRLDPTARGTTPNRWVNHTVTPLASGKVGSSDPFGGTHATHPASGPTAHFGVGSGSRRPGDQILGAGAGQSGRDPANSAPGTATGTATGTGTGTDTEDENEQATNPQMVSGSFLTSRRPAAVAPEVRRTMTNSAASLRRVDPRRPVGLASSPGGESGR